VSREEFFRSPFPKDIELDCSSCSRTKMVWMWLRRDDATWDPICMDCVAIILVWATAAGVEAVAEVEAVWRGN